MSGSNSRFGSELIGLASSFALLIGENKSSEELGILAAFTTSLADNLAILATTKAIQEQNDKQDSSCSDRTFL